MSQQKQITHPDDRVSSINDDIQRLSHAVERVGGTFTQESVKEIYAGATSMLGALNGKIANMIASAKNVFATFFKSEEAFLAKKNPFEYKLFQTGDYMELREKRIVVPRGLNVTYLEHLKTLFAAEEFVKGLLSETLIPLKRYLAELLTDPTALGSQRVSVTLDKLTTVNVDKAKNLLAKDFSRDRAERRPYYTLVSRQKDWAEILKQYNELVFRLESIKRADVMREVDEIIEILEVLGKRIHEEPDVYAASGVTAKTLASFIFNVANQVEFYSYFCYNIEALGASIDNAYDTHKTTQ